MSFSITGQIFHVDEVKQITETFFVREFTLSVVENGEAKSYFFQLSGNKVDMLSQSSVGKTMEVTFSIDCRSGVKDGRTWKNTSLRAYKLVEIQKQRVTAEATPPPPPVPNYQSTTDMYGGMPAGVAATTTIQRETITYERNPDGTLKLDPNGNPIISDLPF